MYKKLPKPDIVSCVQSARRSGFPHDLQPPSSSFANKSSSTTRLPVTGNSHFKEETLSTILSLSFSFLLLPFHKFPRLFWNHVFPVLAFRQGKPPLYFVANYVLLCAVQDAQCNTEESPLHVSCNRRQY